MPPLPPLLVERLSATPSPTASVRPAAISSVRFSVRVPPPDSVTSRSRRVVPLPLIDPPVQSKADAIDSIALPASVPPPDNSRRPSPVKALSVSTLTMPESRCSRPSPFRSKLPAKRLPTLPSARSTSSVPAPSTMSPSASALNSALPPLPEAR